ncbi:MAG TPA: hypothetical protein VLY24_21920 [Bryobacteraceae bacterium]|nr:hypothetical protein [Bryobacteraceae bacterium]
MNKIRFPKFAFLAVLAAGVMQAQSTVATVPFGFQVGTSVLPAGPYWFVASNGLLEVRSLATTLPAVHVLTVAESRTPDPQFPVAVEFLRLGNRYYLSAVWTEAATGVGLLPTAGQRKRMRDYRADSVIVTAGNSEMSVAR